MFEIDRWGWGRGAVDPEPPISASNSVDACRLLALRVSVELLTDGVLSSALISSFARPEVPLDLHAELARFLIMLRRLVEVELPRLRRLIRCESNERVEWSHAPSAGRVDAINSIRASLMRTGNCAPELWQMRHVERFAATPVNRLIAGILRETETKLHRMMGTNDWLGSLLGRERSLVSTTLRVMRAFLAASPLGEIRLHDTRIDKLLADAQHRANELQRFKGIVSWWHELQATRLTNLQITSLDTVRELSSHTCYELVCAMGLVLAFREQFPAEHSDEPGVFVFRARDGYIRIAFGAGRDRPFARRPWTALVTFPQGTDIVIEARNKSLHAAADDAERLSLYCAIGQPKVFGFILTPESRLSELGSHNTAIFPRPFLASICQGIEANPVTEWLRLLDELQSRIHRKD